MKVVHVSTYQTGGAGIAARRLHKLMLKNGIDSKLIVLYKTIDEEEVYDFRTALSPSKQLLNKVQNKLYTLRQNQNVKQIDELFSPINKTWELEQHPLIQSADIVQLHWVEGFVNPLTFLERCPCKIAWTLHDFAPIHGGEHYSGSNHKWNKTRIESTDTAIKKGKLHFIAPSNYMLSKSPYKDHSKHIPNTPDIDNYNLTNRTSEPANILYINTDLHYKRKAHDLAEKTLQELDNKENLVSIGAFVPTNGRHIQTNDNPATIANELKNAKLLIFPTRDDNLPNTAVEAIMCGTPVLSHEVGGLPEIIHSNNGYLCGKNEDITYNDVIKSLEIKNYDEIGISALKAFNPTTILNQHLDFLQHACR